MRGSLAFAITFCCRLFVTARWIARQCSSALDSTVKIHGPRGRSLRACQVLPEGSVFTTSVNDVPEPTLPRASQTVVSISEHSRLATSSVVEGADSVVDGFGGLQPSSGKRSYPKPAKRPCAQQVAGDPEAFVDRARRDPPGKGSSDVSTGSKSSASQGGGEIPLHLSPDRDGGLRDVQHITTLEELIFPREFLTSVPGRPEWSQCSVVCICRATLPGRQRRGRRDSTTLPTHSCH